MCLVYFEMDRQVVGALKRSFGRKKFFLMVSLNTVLVKCDAISSLLMGVHLMVFIRATDRHQGAVQQGKAWEL